MSNIPSSNTRPNRGYALLWLVFGAMMVHGGIRAFHAGGTHKGMMIFSSALGVLLAGYGVFVLCFKKAAPTSLQDSVSSVEGRLDELERLKRREMVTPEEYATKRQEILKDL